MTTATGLALFKGFWMLNNRDKYEEETGTARPAALSRRAIHMSLAGVSLVASVFMGIQIPEAQIAGAADAVIAIMDTFEQNKALALTAWSSVGVIVGHFRRKK